MAPCNRWQCALILTIVAVFPRVARADLEPARAALAHGDHSVAEPLLRAARGAERNEADQLLGRLFMETGRYEEARQLGERLARTPATRVDALTLEGEALMAVGRYDDAVAR